MIIVLTLGILLVLITYDFSAPLALSRVTLEREEKRWVVFHFLCCYSVLESCQHTNSQFKKKKIKNKNAAIAYNLRAIVQLFLTSNNTNTSYSFWDYCSLITHGEQCSCLNCCTAEELCTYISNVHIRKRWMIGYMVVANISRNLVLMLCYLQRVKEFGNRVLITQTLDDIQWHRDKMNSMMQNMGVILPSHIKIPVAAFMWVQIKLLHLCRGNLKNAVSLILNKNLYTDSSPVFKLSHAF